MFLIILLTITYLIVAGAALLMTVAEQRKTGDRSLFLKALGFLACALWPVTFLTVAAQTALVRVSG